MRSPKWGRGEESGAVLVEFSLVFVLFAFICYALVAFGLAMNLKSNLTHAVSNGARAAIGADALCADVTVDPCATRKRQAAIAEVMDSVRGQSTEVKDQVAAQLGDGTANTPNVNIAYCNGASGPYCIFVKVPFDYKDHPIVPSAPGLGIVMPDTLTADANVQLTN